MKRSSHRVMATALASLGRLDEAEEHRASNQEIALKSEDEVGLAEGQYILGLMEKARGNYLNAIGCFEESYRYHESINRRVRMNYSLKQLAECEVALYTSGISEVGSARWLELLEETSRDRSYSGYLGIALILKGELRAKQGLIKKSRECLSEAIEISKRPETKFLKDMIAALLDKPELSASFEG